MSPGSLPPLFLFRSAPARHNIFRTTRNMSSPRRQNISCDTCRHAKRRCPSKDGGRADPVAACSRCLRLKLPCTWRFVNAHATAKLMVQNTACGSDGYQGRGGEWSRTQDSNTLDGPVCQTAQHESDPFGTPPIELAAEGTPDLAPYADAGRWKTKDRPARRQPASPRPDMRISRSSTSLNQGFVCAVLAEKQTAHYQQALRWCKDRFLSQQSNPFRPANRYLLVREDLDREFQGHEVAVMADPVYRLSVFQIARLLDEIAELYGNSLNARDFCNALRAQEAVLKAWTMQWFVSREVGRRDASVMQSQQRTTSDADDLLESMRHRDVYSAYWWRAHRLLADSKGSSSFTRMLAVFMFHMAAVPDGVASRLSLGDTPLDLLDRALLQTQVLLRLLHDFTDRLPSCSRYGSLLECAGSIVHWYGYMRDTSASMLSTKMTALSEVSINDTAVLRDSARTERSDITTTVDVEMAYHRLASNTIALWRRAVHLKDASGGDSADPSSCVDALLSCFNIVAASDEADVRDLELGLTGCVPMRPASVAACGKSSTLTRLPIRTQP